MKFSKAKYAITKRYYDQLNDRVEIFRQNTKTNKTLHTTLVTTLGMKPNMYSSAVQSEVMLDDLFVNL